MEKEWKRYPVFHLDFNGNNFSNPNELMVRLENYVATQEVIYGKSSFDDTLGSRFAYVLKAAHEKTGLRAVVLGDFWFRTGTPAYLVRLLSHFNENLNEIVNKYYPTSSFIDYKDDG